MGYTVPTCRSVMAGMVIMMSGSVMDVRRSLQSPQQINKIVRCRILCGDKAA